MQRSRKGLCYQPPMMSRRLVTTKDNRTVDINDNHALDYWEKEFEVKKKKIIAAVHTVGTKAADVKRQLRVPK